MPYQGNLSVTGSGPSAGELHSTATSETIEASNVSAAKAGTLPSFRYQLHFLTSRETRGARGHSAATTSYRTFWVLVALRLFRCEPELRLSQCSLSLFGTHVIPCQMRALQEPLMAHLYYNCQLILLKRKCDAEECRGPCANRKWLRVHYIRTERVYDGSTTLGRKLHEI